MQRATRTLAAAAAALLVTSAAHAQSAPAVPALNRADLDTTCAPCKNFYRFANGGWIARNPIPAAYSSWGAFNELRDRNEEVLRQVLDNAVRQRATTSDANTRLLGNFYATCMDSAATERAGYEPIRADLQRIDRIRTRDELRAEIARMHEAGQGVLFGFGGNTDIKNSSRVIASAGQGGLGLPDRDYYLKDDSASRKMRADYTAYLTNMLKLVGESDAQAQANVQRILALETALAQASMDRVRRRDPNAQYHYMSVAQADAQAPGVGFRAYLNALGLSQVDSLNMAHPEFFKAAGHELETRSLDDWKAYIRSRIVTGAAGSLSTPFVNEAFRFSSALTGAREQQPRWRRCLRTTDGLLGDALGQEYVKTAFTAEAKAKMMEMIGNLRAVMAERIRANEWMGEATKSQALAKLDSLGQKIGYPDKWLDYSPVRITTDHHLNNLRAISAFYEARDQAKIGGPVDRDEWFMTPPTVNAYYSPTGNEIGFPAGRLQPPFFHPNYDEAANYGGVGGTIGHEITHGFDDQGRKYDAAGNLREWWTAEDAARFGERAAVVERMYGDYTVLDSLHVNGKLTLGENIADIGGVSIAFHAMQRALQGKGRALIDGFTPEQRFFLAYAQARRSVYRDPQLRLMIQTDPHSPGEFRVNGPLSNMPEFAAAFGCKEGDPMVRPASARASIWE
jgi:putative endopeptidase